MKPSGRLLSYLSLGVLTVLGVGAIILSLVTAPPNADQHLQIASRNTAAATSFQVRLRIAQKSQGATGSSTNVSTATVQYHAPDQLSLHEVTMGREVTERALGRTVFISFDGGHSWERQNESGSASNAVVMAFLKPLQAASTVTGVEQHGGVYRYVSSAPALATAFGIPTSTAVHLSAVVHATIKGEFLQIFDVTFADVHANSARYTQGFLHGRPGPAGLGAAGEGRCRAHPRSAGSRRGLNHPRRHLRPAAHRPTAADRPSCWPARPRNRPWEPG